MALKSMKDWEHLATVENNIVGMMLVPICKGFIDTDKGGDFRGWRMGKRILCVAAKNKVVQSGGKGKKEL
jgi:hypothetical protein